MKRVSSLPAHPALARLAHCSHGKLLRTALACAVLGLATGCASLVSGTHREVLLRSRPDGAKVTVVNAEGVTVAEGVTPFTARLRKGKAYFAGEHYTFTFRKEGFCDTQQVVQSTVSSWYFGNLLFGGAIGLLIVDPHTGSMYTLPKEVSAQLASTKAAVAAEASRSREPEVDDLGELHTVRLQDVPASLRTQLIKLN